MATVHNGAKKDDVAKTVLMPGDPLRAKFISEKYLEDAKQINSVRNMFGYTGKYKGREVSVMGSGMGIPSIGIYSYELFHFYDVESIIRIGSCGAYSEDVKVLSVILAQGASTNSRYAHQFNLPGTYAPIADFDLLTKAYKASIKKGINVYVGNVLSSDVFYDDDKEAWKKWKGMGVLGVEMEAAALYMNAARAGKKSLSILTVSDNLATGEETTSEQREKNLTDMIEIALELA